MKHFTEITGHYGHTHFRSNFNDKNDKLILQINVKGILVNRCILGTKTGQPYIKFNGDKFAVNLDTLLTK